MVDLHERFETAAARPVRDVPLAQVERRLRARRRTRVGGVVFASVACLALVGGGIALATDGDGGRVSATRPASETAGTITAELPEGWEESPLDPTITPLEIVRFGTKLLPPEQPYATQQELCSLLLSSDDAYVIVGDYFTEPTPTPGEEFPPRGDDFVSTRPFGTTDCVTGTSAALETASGPWPLLPGRVTQYFFSESGRDLRALVGIGTLADDARRDEVFAVLDSLVISTTATTPTTIEPIPEPPTAPPTVAPTIPPSTAPLTDDEAAIDAAFVGWISTKPPEDGAAFVEDGDVIRPYIAAAGATSPGNAAYTGRTDIIKVTGPTTADVTYTLLVHGQPAGTYLGEAVKVDGVWKVRRETVCTLIEIAPGVTCPPRTG